MSVRDVLRDARAAGDIAPLVAAIPYLSWMGISAKVEGERVICHMRFKDTLVGNPSIPALHGGTLSALLETTGSLQVLWELGDAALPKIVTITVDYLRSAKAEDAFCRAEITRRGRRVVNVRAEVYQGDPSKPVTSATMHFLVEQP